MLHKLNIVSCVLGVMSCLFFASGILIIKH